MRYRFFSFQNRHYQAQTPNGWTKCFRSPIILLLCSYDDTTLCDQRMKTLPRKHSFSITAKTDQIKSKMYFHKLLCVMTLTYIWDCVADDACRGDDEGAQLRHVSSFENASL